MESALKNPSPVEAYSRSVFAGSMTIEVIARLAAKSLTARQEPPPSLVYQSERMFPPNVVAEIGHNHQGDIEKAKALLAEAGLPDGVFNVVHGDKEAVDALLVNPDVASISFVGSNPNVIVLGKVQPQWGLHLIDVQIVVGFYSHDESLTALEAVDDIMADLQRGLEAR